MEQRVNYGFVQFSRVSKLTGMDHTPKVLESKDKMDMSILYKKNNPSFPSILSCHRVYIFRRGKFFTSLVGRKNEN